MGSYDGRSFQNGFMNVGCSARPTKSPRHLIIDCTRYLDNIVHCSYIYLKVLEKGEGKVHPDVLYSDSSRDPFVSFRISILDIEK